ncbi:aromatic amino acid lyase, partial [Rhodovulum sulfidophilum]|nr:aromatic amino acid lyase [Rhodovulum sulfidophilum]
MLTLTPGETTLAQLETLWREEAPARLAETTGPAIAASAARIAAAAQGDQAVYGVNTGFGKLASVRIPPEDTATLQRNLILSHCC